MAALVTSAATGALALSNKNTYLDSCDLGSCNHGTWQTAHRLAIGTDVLMAVGVAAAVTTVVLALVRPRAERAVADRLLVRW